MAAVIGNYGIHIFGIQNMGHECTPYFPSNVRIMIQAEQMAQSDLKRIERTTGIQQRDINRETLEKKTLTSVSAHSLNNLIRPNSQVSYQLNFILCKDFCKLNVYAVISF